MVDLTLVTGIVALITGASISGVVGRRAEVQKLEALLGRYRSAAPMPDFRKNMLATSQKTEAVEPPPFFRFLAGI